MVRRASLFAVMVCVLLLSSSCINNRSGAVNNPQGSQTAVPGTTAQAVKTPDPTPTPAPVKEKEAVLYYGNIKHFQPGGSSLPSVIALKKKVKYENTSLEEAIVRELFTSPGGDYTSEIPQTAKLLGVTVKDGIAIVNFAGDGMNGSSTQERVTIDQIVYSLTELEGIKGVQFQLDGKTPDSLMGHIEASQVFIRQK